MFTVTKPNVLDALQPANWRLAGPATELMLVFTTPTALRSAETVSTTTSTNAMMVTRHLVTDALQHARLRLVGHAPTMQIC